MSQMSELDLFLDESGTFTETSTVLSERPDSPRTSPPSQLVGILAQRGALSRDVAMNWLGRAAHLCGVAVEGVPQLHATHIKASDVYDAVLRMTIDECRVRGWQPVRLVNAERVVFGNRVSAYTNMLAELFCRICRHKWREGTQRVRIHLTLALVFLPDKDKDVEPEFIEQPDYRDRLQEHLAFAHIRHGLARESVHWELGSLTIVSAKHRADLQICDWLSNASYADYRRCTSQTRDALKALFGVYDETLRVQEPLDRAGRLAQEGAYGLALLSLAEIGLSKRSKGGVQDEVERLLSSVRDALAPLGHRARDCQLQALVDWIEQIVDYRRTPGEGLKAVDWIRDAVLIPLAERLGDDSRRFLDWFAYALDFWELTARNHMGDLIGARRHADTMLRVGDTLACAADRFSLLARGMIARAVHLTDSFEHAQAARLMLKVSDAYGSSMELLLDEMTESHARRRSDIKAMALGTALQAEIFAGLQDAARFPVARSLSDQALEEFQDRTDRHRQLQYRCQLETLAGAPDAARHFLAEALDAPDATHQSIGVVIRRMAGEQPGSEGFALLHWMRLGVRSVPADREQYDAFREALRASAFQDSPWYHGHYCVYPAQGILRLWTALCMMDGDCAAAQRSLSIISRSTISAGNPPLALMLLHLACLAESAVAAIEHDPDFARTLLESERSQMPGLIKVHARCIGLAGNAFPAVSRLLSLLEPACQHFKSLTANTAMTDALRAFAQAVPY